jgi:hypothetical protein
MNHALHNPKIYRPTSFFTFGFLLLSQTIAFVLVETLLSGVNGWISLRRFSFWIISDTPSQSRRRAHYTAFHVFSDWFISSIARFFPTEQTQLPGGVFP